ncbi:MAG TPA: D-alanine--D-alanine ligase [Candidatus Synoicihabitans sp.]|nr:D-alanine--D-alanine ligase [Candidatus Synoicihabitans sp.]
MSIFSIVVFAGGTSSERDVSLGSGKACALALARSYPTSFAIVESDVLPRGLDPRREVVFSTLHGTFGEDGRMQALLDAAGVQYTGCDAASSALCFDKQRTKLAVAARGVRTAPGLTFTSEQKPSARDVVARLGPRVVFKPNASGSSVGLAICDDEAAIAAKLREISAGEWLAEQRIIGREVTVGLLRGRALGVVEIAPQSGVFDYTSKYTKGLTTYLAPAPIPPELEAAVRNAAETAYAACGCRDYARIDFIITPQNDAFLLEINTLPGMKETSLLPMSARCAGLDFTALVKEMVEPARERLSAAHAALSR